MGMVRSNAYIPKGWLLWKPPGRIQMADKYHVFTEKIGYGRPRSQWNNSEVVLESGSLPLLFSTNSTFDSGIHYADGSNGEKCLDIQHGILPSYTVRLRGRVKTVLYYPRRQSYSVLHSQHVHHYTKQELVEELPLRAGGKEVEVQRLLHAAQYGVYVGVCKHRMVLFNSSFECLHQVDCVDQNSTSVFNSWSGEVITAGIGHFKVDKSKDRV